MKSDGIGKKIKRSVVGLALDSSRNIDLDKFNNNKNMPVYDDVEERLNVAYINRDEVPLAMDIFKPKAPEGTELPVIVTIHGGGLTMGDRRLSRPFARLLAHRGYLVFSIEYRLVPSANVCQELDDVCAGLDLIGTMLVDYDVDFTRIFIAAESAGAYLATYVSALKGSKKLQDAIGYKPGRLVFKAIGIMSGMIYTNLNDPCGWVLSDQIYGKKRADENFLQYMNPEHPEIINNLPPTYLITSRGDFVNHYSIMMNEALKKAGKPCHLLYYGDINLQHAFTTMQIDDPRSVEAIDKMLAWFEEQAAVTAKQTATRRRLSRMRSTQKEKMADGSLDQQRVWKYLKERAAADETRMAAPAVIDCTRTYTYGQMFAIWDKYARAFSALGMTGAKKARVGIAGAITAEPLFAFYALNMTGAEVSMLSYPDFLPGGRWKTMVEKEHITDLIITDIMVTPQLWYELNAQKKKLGLRHIILAHSRMGGPCVGPGELVFNEFNYHALQRLEGTLFLDELAEKYKKVPISYGEDGGDHIALIVHTSGSTKGTRKPLPYTDRAVNAVASSVPNGYADVYPERFEVGSRIKVALSFDMSSFLNAAGLANMTLASGNTVVLTFFGFMHPKFVKAIDYYKTDALFISSFMMDSWMKLPDIDKIDFSSLKVLAVGGSYLSLEKLEKYQTFLKKQGFAYSITRGYGMSEIGGAQLYVPVDCPDDILGYPNPPEDYYVLDEEDGKFHCVSEGERTGVMYVTSRSMCTNLLDGKELFPLTEIDGRKFVCTNDVVRVNADGSLSYAGRMDKFFVNNEGVRFESGMVETMLQKLPCVSQIAIAPVLDKRIHDTVPVLYVKPADAKADNQALICGRLEKIYKEERELIGTALPSQLVLVDDIPCTATGKVDTFKLSRERSVGRTFNILPKYNEKGELKTVTYEIAKDVSTIKAGALPQGMGGDSAMGLFEAFNNKPATKPFLVTEFEDLAEIVGLIKAQRQNSKDKVNETFAKVKTLIPGMKDGEMPKPPQKLMNTVMDMQGVVYHHDTFNYDFED